MKEASSSVVELLFSASSSWLKTSIVPFYFIISLFSNGVANHGKEGAEIFFMKDIGRGIIAVKILMSPLAGTTLVSSALEVVYFGAKIKTKYGYRGRNPF